MVKRWLMSLIREAVREAIREESLVRLQEVKQEVANQVKQEVANQVKQEDQGPLRSTRPSWPRMKRYLEEQDVRAGLALNREADQVERYWREKQQGD